MDHVSFALLGVEELVDSCGKFIQNSGGCTSAVRLKIFGARQNV